MNKPTDKQQQHQTLGVKTLLGHPKKAIIRLSIPMIIAMSVQSIYNIADAIWVSGLGANALSAIGFFFPFFILAMALAVGAGIGGGAAISQRIGAKDKDGANDVAVHTIIIMIIISFIYSVPLTIFARPIFKAFGAKEALDYALDYASVIFPGAILIFFSNVANSILRSEGDAKRSMVAILIGSVLNIILDPFFIYKFDINIFNMNFKIGLNLGVAGAAWATIISIFISCLFLFFWLFIKKNTYVSFKFKGFKLKKKVVAKISQVGLPAMLSQGSMSFMMFLLTIIVNYIGLNDGVAIFTTGWRVVIFAILPLIGITTAVISVAGATFGAKEYIKLRISFYYAVKMALIIEIIIAVISFVFAGVITNAFTWSPDSFKLREGIITLLMVVSFFYPAVAFGMLSSGMFQGIGKGFNALIITLTRTIFLSAGFSVFFGIILNMGLYGIWVGLVLSSWISSIGAFIWASIHIRKLVKTQS